MFAEKACFDVLCTCKATSLSSMARLVDTATMQELLLKLLQVLHGGKEVLYLVLDRTAALTGVSRSTAQKILEEKKKARDEQQHPKQPPSSTSNVSLDDFDQGVVRRAIASMYSLKKVLPRTELKQSLVTLAARVVFTKISFIQSLLTHAVG